MKFIWNSILRQIRRMASSPLYLILEVAVPLGCMFFFLSLLDEGLPTRVPTAVVDMDQSQMSRQVTRELNANELLDIRYKVEDYTAAMQKVRDGSIFGFFVIPANFQRDAIAGNTPTLDYYTNLTYFVPGTLSFKGFKTISVTTAGGVVVAKLSSVGLTPDLVKPLVQPVVINAYGKGNPWTNYSYYLTPSFSFATLALLIMIMSVYSITVEIKHKSSPQWLDAAGGNIYVALIGKLLPQSLLFSATAVLMQSILFRYWHFPMFGSTATMLLATILFVFANQSFGAMIACILPNPRLALSVVSLLGILTFSFAGFSFPVDKMYGAIGIFSYLMPVRYWFLIYVNTALNGFDIYYVRYYFAVLAGMLVLWMLFAWRLKKACINPVYVP